jgi:hypothetical protein
LFLVRFVFSVSLFLFNFLFCTIPPSSFAITHLTAIHTNLTLSLSIDSRCKQQLQSALLQKVDGSIPVLAVYLTTLSVTHFEYWIINVILLMKSTQSNMAHSYLVIIHPILI